MTQQPSEPLSDESGLARALQTLSAREQITMLVRATRPLSKREKVEVWRVAGFSVLRDRLLPILLHVVLKRVLAGALWWMLCGIAAVLVLLVLAWVEQINPNAVGPVLSAIIGFFCGFLLFACVDFLHSLIQLFGKTCSRQAREALLARLSQREPGERLALLRILSASLAAKVPGESLLDSLVTVLVLLFASALLIGLALVLSDLWPILGHFPWLFLIAGVAFLLGLLGPGQVQHRLLVRSMH